MGKLIFGVYYEPMVAQAIWKEFGLSVDLHYARVALAATNKLQLTAGFRNSGGS